MMRRKLQQPSCEDDRMTSGRSTVCSSKFVPPHDDIITINSNPEVQTTATDTQVSSTPFPHALECWASGVGAFSCANGRCWSGTSNANYAVKQGLLRCFHRGEPSATLHLLFIRVSSPSLTSHLRRPIKHGRHRCGEAGVGGPNVLTTTTTLQDEREL